LLTFGLWQPAISAPAYQINGFYLGATPDDMGVAIEVDQESEEKLYEVKTKGAHLFFIKIEETGELRLYRIVKEQNIRPDQVVSVLSSLKKRYGTPDKQAVKTNSIRPKSRTYYITTAKNKAVWHISETQDFITEIEKNRVVYELIDHNPENIRSPKQAEGQEDGGFGEEGWDPDY
jgi:hypothetical protein